MECGGWPVVLATKQLAGPPIRHTRTPDISRVYALKDNRLEDNRLDATAGNNRSPVDETLSIHSFRSEIGAGVAAAVSGRRQADARSGSPSTRRRIFAVAAVTGLAAS